MSSSYGTRGEAVSRANLPPGPREEEVRCGAGRPFCTPLLRADRDRPFKPRRFLPATKVSLASILSKISHSGSQRVLTTLDCKARSYDKCRTLTLGATAQLQQKHADGAHSARRDERHASGPRARGQPTAASASGCERERAGQDTQRGTHTAELEEQQHRMYTSGTTDCTLALQATWFLRILFGYGIVNLGAKIIYYFLKALKIRL